MKSSFYKIWTFWIRIILIVSGIVVPLIFTNSISDFWKAISFASSFLSLLSVLNSIDSEKEFLNMNTKLTNENKKIAKLYDNINRLVSEKELFAIEEDIGLRDKNIKNEVVIISNDLSKEFGIWKETVIRNIEDKNVKYTYFTSKNNINKLTGIQELLKTKNVVDVNEKLKVYYNDEYFHLYPQYGEIVIYKKLSDNIIRCFICFCDTVVNPISIDDNLFYEDVNPRFIEKIVPKISYFETMISKENLKQSCKKCSHNSLWERYTFTEN